jgi:ADP-ribose pyrophosphatase YjhB (NUDIX family)
MKFCSHCGQPNNKIIPTGDNRERYVCSICDTIHYQNPRIIAGCLPIHGEQVLLCKRAIEPRLGRWTLPAGFMENGETTEEGALRESFEEANANIDVDGLYAIYSLPQINQVHLFYRGQLSDLDFKAGPESTEVALFDEADIPWDDLAFAVVTKTLQHYFADRKTGQFP